MAVGRRQAAAARQIGASVAGEQINRAELRVSDDSGQLRARQVL